MSSQTKKIGAKCRICGTELHITIDSNRIADVPALVVNGKKIDPAVAMQAAQEVENELKLKGKLDPICKHCFELLIISRLQK